MDKNISIHKINRFLKDKDCNVLSEKLEKIHKETRKTRNTQFNIFETISDQYKKENLHSDILAHILDPSTKEIGNKAFLDVFIDFLNKQKKISINEKHFDESTSVTREERRIDILIKNENNKKAIIIENKINGAEDQDDQLARYYEKVINDDYEVVGIVYLTLLQGEPSCNYSKKFKKYEAEIKKLLLPICAIHEKKENLSDGFLIKCIEVMQEEKIIEKKRTREISSVFISQYKELLNIIGENFMAQGTKEELLKKLFDNRNITNNITEVWGERKEIIPNMIHAKVKVENAKSSPHSPKLVKFDFTHTFKGKAEASALDIFYDDSYDADSHDEKWRNGWITLCLFSRNTYNTKTTQKNLEELCEKIQLETRSLKMTCYDRYVEKGYYDIYFSIPFDSPLDDMINKVQKIVSKIVKIMQSTE